MGNTWFTSDLHFGHEKVSEIRGFANLRDHDHTISNNWAKVRPSDTIYVLGDLTVDQRKEEYALSMINLLPGTKHLIAGNHDSVSSIHRTGWKKQRRYLEVFESVRDFGRIRIDKQDVLLSHYPYGSAFEADHGVTRYESYRLFDTGMPLIHGHTHLGHKLHWTKQVTRMIHVGLDAWDLKPVSLKQVTELLKEEA